MIKYIPNQTVLKKILTALLLLIAILAVVLCIKKCSSSSSDNYQVDSGQSFSRSVIARQESLLGLDAKIVYGINVKDLDIETGEIQSGETFSKLLNGKYDVNISVINKLIEKTKGIFDLRDLRAGRPYAALLSHNTDSTSKLEYLVYEKNKTEFITFAMKDSIYVEANKKDVLTKEHYIEGNIESTLYGSIGASLSNRLADIFESTIDFTAIQAGDGYRILYEREYVDTVSIGVGKVYGIEITHKGKPYIAIRYEQGETMGYWDENGNNMKKAFLRSPLSYRARVSSRYGMRSHPIRRIRQMHNGIDYAAPSGTPVLAVADGTVTRAGWDSGGGGNRIWLRHSRGLESAYLHLRGFAKGIKSGVRVRKGQVIGYVGSTGMSTGAHLDFRIKQNGKYINPDRLPTTPGDPINQANRAGFNIMREDVLGVMSEYKGRSESY